MNDMPAPKGSVRVVSKRRGGAAPDPGETVIDIDRTNPILGEPAYFEESERRGGARPRHRCPKARSD